MKKLLSVFLVGAILLTLAACGGGAKKETSFDPAADAKTLLASGCFSEELTEIDLDTACSLYGIDRSAVKAGAVYGSTGATAEELAILTFSKSEDLSAALKQLQYRIEDRTEQMTTYLPGEIPKLEKAVLVTRNDDSVLLVIANDYGPVNTFLGG